MTKVWYDNEDIHNVRPDSIQVQLYSNGEKLGSAITLNAENQWTYVWKNLDKNEAGVPVVYTIEELNVPENYVSKISGGTTNGFIITNTCNHLDMIEIPVEKLWDDADNQDGLRTDRIKVQLYADGVPEGDAVILSDANQWTYKWEKLEKNEDGELIVYTVEEIDVPDGYQYVVTGNNIHGYVITNTHKTAETKVSVRKIWDDNDNQDGLRPEMITVLLLADGETTGKKVDLTAANDWTYTWDKLPVNKDGKAIQYTIKEDGIPSGYTSVITGSASEGYIITNTHKPEIMDIPVRKVWFDNDDIHGSRPESIEVQLYADGNAYGTPVVLSSTNDWSYTWNSVERFKDGKPVNYTINEIEVPEGYSSIVTGETENGFVITNSCSHLDIKEITVNKVWKDSDNQDGIRPDSVIVQLYGNGEAVGESIVLNERNQWTYTWEELKFSDDHKEIEYTVKEEAVDGYQSVITGNMTDGYVITNSHNVETFELPVKKVWNDKNNSHTVRPDNIKVQLYANGKKLGSEITLNAENQWMYVWKDLNKNEAGIPIVYTIEELNVPEHYTSVISGNAENGFVITNNYIPEESDDPDTDDVKTGDHVNIVSLCAIFIGSLMCLIVLAFEMYRKKRNK